MNHKELEKHWAIWWILELCQRAKNAGRNEISLQVITVHTVPGEPMPEYQEQALAELQKANAVSVVRTNGNDAVGQFRKMYRISLIEPGFTELFNKYAEAMELPTTLREYLPPLKELINDTAEEVKTQLNLEYHRFIDLKGRSFYEGLARYANTLVRSKTAREIIDKDIQNPDKVSSSVKEFNHSSGMTWTGLYRIPLALSAFGSHKWIPESPDPLFLLGFRIFSAAVNEVFVREVLDRHAGIFKITEDNYRRYVHEMNRFITPKLDEQAKAVAAEVAVEKERKLEKQKHEFEEQIKQQIADQATEHNRIIDQRVEETLTKSHQEQPLIELPDNAEWKYLKLAFTAPTELEISYKKKRIGNYTAEFLGFKGRQKFGVDRQWELLRLLSVAQNNPAYRPERKAIAKTAGWELANLDKIKEQLETKLHKVFDIPDTSPFKNTKQLKYYETEFTLLPEQILRRDEDPDTDTYAYDDSKRYGDVNDD